jgi:hypothetical protein
MQSKSKYELSKYEADIPVMNESRIVWLSIMQWIVVTLSVLYAAILANYMA